MKEGEEEKTRGQSRWLGLRSYEEEDSGVFFGREVEAEQLYRMLMRETLTTVFAPSGTGKTSLLRAGLFPKLRKNGFLPLRLRLEHGVEGVDHGRWLRSKIEEAAEREGYEIDTIVPPQAGEEEETLWEYLHRVELWDSENRLLTPVIVLDQFEEIFTVGAGRPESEKFLRTLADLVEKRMPSELRARLDARGERSSIPTEIQGFKIVISLREDFVAHLDDLRKTMPSVMHNRYPLHPLTGEQAFDVVLGPGKGIVDEDVAHRIVRIVAKADEQNVSDRADLAKLVVEPNLLSLVCHELDQRRLRKNESRINVGGLEDASQGILRRFYEESFRDLDPRARIFVEDHLLTATGFRKSEPIDDSLEAGMSERARKQLIDRHVLRQLDRKDMPHVELTHDLLAGVVKESRDRRRDYEHNEEIKQARKKQVKRLQFFAGVSCILFLLAGYASLAALRASKAEAKAEKNAKEAERLVNFMANDLYDRLLPIGRLDILETVALQAQEHFDAEGNVRGTDSARARVLNKIANVLAKRGNISEAIATHRNAIDELTEIRQGGDFHSDQTAEIVRTLVEMRIDYSRVLSEWVSPHEALRICEEAQADLGTLAAGKRLPIDDVERLEQELTLRRAQIHHHLGHHGKSLSLLDEIEIEDTPPRKDQLGRQQVIQAEIHRARARSFRKQGGFPDAFTNARAALLLYNNLSSGAPGNEEWTFRKASVLRELGEIHAAIGDFEGARDKFEPALAIATTKVEQQKPIGSNSGAINTQWQYLAATVSTELGRLWLDSVKSDTPSALKLENRFSLARKYIDEAFKAIETKPAEDSSPTLTSNILRARALMLLSRWLVERDQIAEADKNLRLAIEAVRGNGGDAVDGPTRRLLEAEILALIGEDTERFFNRSELPAEYSEAVDALESILAAEPGNDVARIRLADLQGRIADAYKLRGKATEAVQSQRKVVEHWVDLASGEGNCLARRRSAGLSRLRLAKLLSAAGGLDGERREAIQLCDMARETLNGLKTGTLFRVSDRLNAAEALHTKGILLEDLGRKEEAEPAFRMASALGHEESTRRLIDFVGDDPGEKKKIEALAKLHERKSFSLPCRFRDELQGDAATKVTRVVYSDVIVTAPFVDSSAEAGSARTLGSEIERLRSDFMLEIEPRILAEIEKRNHLIETNREAELSLAQITEYAFNSESKSMQGSTDNALLNLHSPVRNTYPKKRPTVIGLDCWFDWEFVGTADKLRDFQLQVSTSIDFRDGLVLDKRVNGTRYRLNFAEESFNQFLNRRLFWRVRPLSGLREVSSDSSSTEWSLVQEVEVYETVWDRVIETGKVRAGVTQFEGDLLKLEQGSTKLDGFDGKVLQSIGQSLLEQWKTDRSARGMSTDQELGQFIEPLVYGWDGMFEAVSRNEVDFILSIITRTKERERRYGMRFSEPYYETQLAIVYFNPPDGTGNLSVKSIDDVLKLDLVANRGFRGEEIGELLVGGKINSKSFTNLRLLLESVQEGQSEAAITDLAFVENQINQRGEDLRHIVTYPLTALHYNQLLIREKQREIPNQRRLEKFEAIQNDYGQAEWEQYAVGVSERDDRRLLDYINRAILELRRSDYLAKICEEEKLPAPDRLIGPEQQPEEMRRLATVVPLSPNSQESIRSGLKSTPVVMGDTMTFRWKPLGQEVKNGYRIQVASAPGFASDVTLVSEWTEAPEFSVDLKKFPDIRGELYWRAKKATSRTEEPLFPVDGWCSPVRFSRYDDSLDRIRRTGEIRVGVTVTNGYCVFRDKNLELKGFDLEIMDYIALNIADAIGVEKLRIVPEVAAFPDIFPRVESNQIDLAISGITATEKREQDYDIRFSQPYCQTRQAAIWIEDPAIGGIADLVGERFIVFEKTRAKIMAGLLTDPDLITSARDNPKAYLLEKLLAGHARTTITDYPTAIKLVNERPREGRQTRFRIQPIGLEDLGERLSDPDQLVDRYAIPMQKDQERLIKIVNQAIHKLRHVDRKLLEEIFEKYDLDESRVDQASPFELDWDSAAGGG